MKPYEVSLMAEEPNPDVGVYPVAEIPPDNMRPLVPCGDGSCNMIGCARCNPPRRIQRQRTKGWRMPESAVYVGRPTPWGNPFTVMNGHRQGWLVWDDRDHYGYTDEETSNGYIAARATKDEAYAVAVERYETFAREFFGRSPLRDRLAVLRGRDLACWCPLDRACHADVLLELANPRRAWTPGKRRAERKRT